MVKAPVQLLKLVLGITILAMPGYCDSALFTSMASNPANPYQPLSASALFSVTGSQLTIRVTNTSAPAAYSYLDSDVLTGVYFSSQALDLTPVSAIASQLVSASGITTCTSNCDAGSGWAYQSLTVPDYGLMNGISAVQTPVFLFSNFSTLPAKLGGTGYGIVPQSYPTAIGTALNDGPYSLGSATFVLNVPSSFTLTSIDHIVLSWGTYANDPFGAGNWNYFTADDETPEPSTWILTATAAALLLSRRAIQAARRRRSA